MDKDTGEEKDIADSQFESSDGPGKKTYGIFRLVLVAQEA